MSDSWQDVDNSYVRDSDGLEEDDRMTDQYKDTSVEFIKGIREMEALGLVEIGALGSWSVSSFKSGSGVKEVREDSPHSYWQSDGGQPHYLDIHFSKQVSISRLSIYTDYLLDESYTPLTINILAGHGFHDLLEVETLHLEKPTGWTHVDFNEIKGLEDGLKTFLVRLLVAANHHNGKDTHLRSVKVYSPLTVFSMDTSILGPFTSSKLLSESTIR